MTIQEVENKLNALRLEWRREADARDRHHNQMKIISGKIHELNDTYEQMTEVRNDDGEWWAWK